jgi:26S proteasome regulatory subunit N2
MLKTVDINLVMLEYQAIGIALESRRLDIVQDAVKKGDTPSLLKYVMDCSMHLIQHRGFRNQVISELQFLPS